MRRADVLDAAMAAVTVDRAATHGSASDGFARIADLWTAMLGRPFTALDVANCMIAVKLVRAANSPRHADNWIDICGYAALAGEISGAEA